MRAVPFILAAFLLLGGPVRAEDFYLISVGNNLGDPSEQPLRFAERDAREIAAIMQRLGGVPSQNVVQLLGEDAVTLRKVILDMNARIRAKRDAERRDSVLMVFYSGHADAMGLHLGGTTLPFDELKAMMAGSPAKVRLLVIDSCRSGGVTRVKGAVPAEEFVIELHNGVSAEGLVIITSSAAGEDSYESDRLRASFFSHHLANALRGAADSNRDGLVTLDEAYGYAYQQTLRSSGRTMKLQHPTYHYDIKGKGELVLTRLANDRNRSGRLLITEEGYYLLMEEDENGPIVAEISVGKAGTRLVLPAGDYFVQKRDRTFYMEFEVELSPGQEVSLADIEGRAVEYARLLRKGGGDRSVVHGLYVMAAARGETITGESVTPHLVVGTTFDLPWFSVGLRVRYSRSTSRTADGLTGMIHSEYGLGITFQRYVDMPYVSLALGMLLETAYHTQQFDTSGRAPFRAGWSFGFGGLVGMEVELGAGVFLLAEGGPLTQVFRRSSIEAGTEVGSEIASPFTWWASGGLCWRF